MRTPEQIERYNRQRRERYSNDPEYRERRKREWNEQYGSGSEGRHKRNARYRELRAQNLEAVRNRERRSRRKRSYGLDEHDFARLLDQQEGKCAICLSENPGSRDWHVDHNHVTGVVRGLLCHRCNTGLGLFGEDMDTLCAAAEYLCRETGNTPPGRTL